MLQGRLPKKIPTRPKTSPVHKLKELKQRLRKARKGYRLTKYETFQETMESAVKLKSDRAALKEFAKQADIDPKKLKKLDTNWVTSAAFTFVIGNEQQGWKAARVAEFLHDFKRVPIKDLAEQMRKLGGIEKIMKLAAKEDPRRLTPSKGGKKGGKTALAAKKEPVKSGNVRKEQDGDVDEDDDWSLPEGDGDHSRITIRITPALRAKVLAVETERRVELTGVRIDSDDCLAIQEVRRLKN